MILENREWKVYDVVVEGVSLGMNCRSQFNEILVNKYRTNPVNIARVFAKILWTGMGGVTGVDWIRNFSPFTLVESFGYLRRKLVALDKYCVADSSDSSGSRNL